MRRIRKRAFFPYLPSLPQRISLDRLEGIEKLKDSPLFLAGNALHGALLTASTALEKPWDTKEVNKDTWSRWLTHPHSRLWPWWLPYNALAIFLEGKIEVTCPFALQCKSCPLRTACNQTTMARKVSSLKKTLFPASINAAREALVQRGAWIYAPVTPSLLAFPWLWRVIDLLPFAFPVSQSPLSCFVFTPSHQSRPPFEVEEKGESLEYTSDQGPLTLEGRDVLAWLPEDPGLSWEIAAWLVGRIVLNAFFVLEPNRDLLFPPARECLKCPVLPDCYKTSPREGEPCEKLRKAIETIYWHRLLIAKNIKEWCQKKGFL